MLFTDFEFIFIFLPAILYLYYKLDDDNLLLKLRILVIASLFFYGYWNWSFVPLLVISVIFNFYWGQFLHQNKSKPALLLGILVNLLPIFYYKYYDFFLGSVPFNLFEQSKYSLILPLGISFYTFQQIAYLADVYSKNDIEKSFDKYAFFVIFFPQFIAGPIIHHKYIFDQLPSLKKRNWALFNLSWLYFFFGFIKKFVFADALGGYADEMYALDKYSLEESFIATFGYTFQLYFDFSGYSDMAIGLAGMFGFKLPINFWSPYKSCSINDFWRRWHITLSEFLKNYIYIPLGGNKTGSRYINLLLTMLIGGLWHGASWTFVLWGGIHGLALIVGLFCKKIIPTSQTNRTIGWLTTFIFVSLTWVLFRSENLEKTLEILQGFLEWGKEIQFTNAIILIFISFIIVLLPNSHQIIEKFSNKVVIQSDYWGVLSTNIIKRFVFAHCIATLIMVTFYTTKLDQFFYSKFSTNDYKLGISNKVGEYRGNLYSNPNLYDTRKKNIIVGSSFTMGMGAIQFNYDNEDFISFSLGMGGNSIYNGLKTALNISDIGNIDTIILGVSPLNMGKITTGTFPDQCNEGFPSLGLNFNSARYFHCQSININGSDFIQMFTWFKGNEFKQFHHFLNHIKKISINKPDFESYSLDKNSYSLLNNLLSNNYNKSVEAPTPVRDRKNGSDQRFRWERRGILQSLSTNGDVYIAIKKLKNTLNKKGIKLIIYDTPTPKHINAPHIYPQEFLVQYKAAMKKLTEDVELQYYDLMDLLPYDGNAMNDFIHPKLSQRKLIHKLLLHKIFSGIPNDKKNN